MLSVFRTTSESGSKYTGGMFPSDSVLIYACHATGIFRCGAGICRGVPLSRKSCNVTKRHVSWLFVCVYCSDLIE